MDLENKDPLVLGALVPSVVVLILHNAVIAGHWSIVITIAADVLIAAAVVGWAMHMGVHRTEFGLSRSSIRGGAPPGLLVGLVVITAVAILFASGLFNQVESNSADTSHLWFRLLIGIPIGTALTEELIFRGGLLALWDRAISSNASTAVVSTFFGLWHIAVEIHRLGPAVEPWSVLPAVAATAGASAFVLSPLKRRTNSIIAPVIVHMTANAAVLLAVSA